MTITVTQDETTPFEKIVTVDKNGVVTGLKKGTAKITVTSSGGLKATVNVKVTKK